MFGEFFTGNVDSAKPFEFFTIGTAANVNLQFVNLSIGDCHETATQFLAMTTADIFTTTKQIFFATTTQRKICKNQIANY
ncbi:MAG: hypothetical protein IJ894_13520, partial [Bacteroidales bacterium]|nr:hypothetical protein [Bacteroidales bacterium]